MNDNDFNFSKEEVETLFWIKYWALEKTIHDYRVGKVSSLIRSKEQNLKKEKETKDLMKAWLTEWKEKTIDLLQIKNSIDITSLNSSIYNRSLSKGKLYAILTESATFYPFHPLAQKDKRFQSLEIDNKSYIKNLGLIFSKKEAKMIKKCRKAYENSIYKFTKDLSKKSNILMWSTMAALVAVIMAPYLAGHLGTALFGLHGAAATSAGLAFLGGGALAAGGFGMAGGTFAIMVGGSIIGYSLGDNVYKKSVRSLANEEILISCAKLISFLTVYDVDRPSLIRYFCKSSRVLQMDFEEEVDEFYHGGTKRSLDKKKGDDLKRKPAILVSFRKHIREMKV